MTHNGFDCIIYIERIISIHAEKLKNTGMEKKEEGVFLFFSIPVFFFYFKFYIESSRKTCGLAHDNIILDIILLKAINIAGSPGFTGFQGLSRDSLPKNCDSLPKICDTLTKKYDTSTKNFV